MQGVWYTPGILNQLLQVVLILWGVVESIRFFKDSRNNSFFFNVAFALLSMYIIYGTQFLLSGEVLYMDFYANDQLVPYLYLQSSINSIVPIFLFYAYSKKGYLNESRIRLYAILFVLITISNFYKIQKEIISTIADDNLSDGIVNNVSYDFLSILPFVFFFRKKSEILYIAFAILLFVYLLMGMKRGAIFIGIICFFVFLYATIKYSRKGYYKYTAFVISIIIVFAAYQYILYLYDTNSFFVERINETLDGNTRNRDLIYATIFDATLNDNNYLNFFWGRGANATVRISGNFAHQDWLETACNNGLLGIILLILFYLGILKNLFASHKCCSPMVFMSFTMLFIICFTRTMFSMSIQNMPVFQTLLIGYFMSQINGEHISFKVNRTLYE